MTPDASARAEEAARKAAHDVLTKAARDGERVVCVARIALGGATCVAWPIFKATHERALTDLVVMAMAFGAVAAGVVLLRVDRPRPLTSILVDAALVLGGFAVFVVTPPPHYEGIAREPGLALAYLAILGAGLRLSRTGALLASSVIGAGLVALAIGDALVHPDLAMGSGNVLTIAGLWIASSAFAFLVATRSQRQVVDGARAAALVIDALNAQLRERVRTRSEELTKALAALAERRHDDELAPGTVLGDRFTIDAVLGAGGMGTVYAGVDRATGKRVAVKVMRAPRTARQLDWQRRFLTEARAAASLSHPAIVQALFVDVTDDGVLYQVQELVDGTSLEERLRHGPLSDAEAARVGEVLATALAAAHEGGVVHRDVKPGNVMLTPNAPGLKLVDFGVAKSDDDSGAEIVGTPAFMAPEQLRGGSVTDRADVYAVGLLLAKSIGGPGALDDVIRRCNSDAPTSRPSARELADTLRAIADRLGAAQLQDLELFRTVDTMDRLLAEVAAPSDASSLQRSLTPIVGRYRLEKHIGGDVWRALDERMGRTVALRLADRGDDVAAFVAAARAASRVVHPGLCAIFDVDVANGTPYVAMELVEGHPIEATHVDALRSALDAAHRAGVAHGAVRASNARVVNGVVKLLDLGRVRPGASIENDRAALNALSRK